MELQEKFEEIVNKYATRYVGNGLGYIKNTEIECTKLCLQEMIELIQNSLDEVDYDKDDLIESIIDKRNKLQEQLKMLEK